eukprot:scaffold37258_cov47-Prasinocladus_malaysianus.AAC.4
MSVFASTILIAGLSPQWNQRRALCISGLVSIPLILHKTEWSGALFVEPSSILLGNSLHGVRQQFALSISKVV